MPLHRKPVVTTSESHGKPPFRSRQRPAGGGRATGRSGGIASGTHPARPAAFSAYLAVLSAGPWQTLEALATTMLDDVNNELVPRWCHVSVTATGDGGEHHAVDAEDRQPAWENAAVLAGLPTI